MEEAPSASDLPLKPRPTAADYVAAIFLPLNRKHAFISAEAEQSDYRRTPECALSALSDMLSCVPQVYSLFSIQLRALLLRCRTSPPDHRSLESVI